MAPRTFWKGYLKLSLVTCPVALTPAISENEKVRFHTLNRKTGNRVESRYVDAVTGKPIDEADEVKGYQRGEDDYVVLEDEELDAVGLESTRTIDIDMFVPADSIQWLWYDRPHFLVPDDPVGEEAFSVIRDAMVATKTVGISRVVMYRRERAVMLEPRGKGLILWTLRYGGEVRGEGELFENNANPKTDPKLLELITTLIEERSRPWNPEMVSDPVQSRLLDIIAAKTKKKQKQLPKEKAPEEAGSGNVINIMDALRKSIGAEPKKKGGR
ncbi:Ku protein (plasmid) [Ensifer adhaerens]|uniref:non-homologous end joining protein Ku n=1 Tax=Ensifer adhaerens TaxID=106592 RepID=UPI001CBE4BAA|nr:Ku protein [Ensifer adhaerens]MBZ7927057.1 Ku protein [Ensifer adhaerens]UAX98108.1 Ku protein [Ensifer adhaerens]UAY05489.1 Ku protein [Ensifer adhaerens]UAY12867.1 Ku protein [Ensifer adhaerens]